MTLQSYITRWESTLWIPSNENQTAIIQSSSFALKVLYGFFNLLLVAKH